MNEIQTCATSYEAISNREIVGVTVRLTTLRQGSLERSSHIMPE